MFNIIYHNELGSRDPGHEKRLYIIVFLLATIQGRSNFAIHKAKPDFLRESLHV